MADFDVEFAGFLRNLAAPCVDAVAGRGVETVYVLASMTAVERSFDFFYRTPKGIEYSLEVLGDKERCFRLMDRGLDDMRRIGSLCAAHGMPVPTEIRITCEMGKGSFDVDIEYDSNPFETPEGEYRDPVMDWFHGEKAKWAATHPDSPDPA